MHFDDRLATVLRSGIGSERAMRIQYRQLLDLLGAQREDADPGLLEQGFGQLELLSERLAMAVRAALVREAAPRLSNPGLVALLAEDHPQVASAALGAARLTDAEWLALIPALPIRARGLLRHRRDLDRPVARLLSQLGVEDLVLPQPETAWEDAEILELEAALEAPPHSPALPTDPEPREREEIGALVRRIEAFRKARETRTGSTGQTGDAPRLPLGESQDSGGKRFPPAFDFSTDARARICWADPSMAPMVVGLALANRSPDAPVKADPSLANAMRHRQPITGQTVTLDGAPLIAGAWRLDATPRFAQPGGHFIGYCGRMRRPQPASDEGEAKETPADRIRQLIHELRTPVNAIQGFAEIIQQQLFGPAPHEYRALAAAISGDSARMLAGFDELDRLAKLESGATELDEGQCDFTAVLSATLAQLSPYLESRTASISLWNESEAAAVPLARNESERLAWRIVATVAGALTPGEELDVHMVREANAAVFAFELPAAMSDGQDIFSGTLQTGAQAITAGMFGTGFTLRLARAEAQAAGGSLSHQGDMLRLTLPLLTDSELTHTDGQAGATEEGATSA